MTRANARELAVHLIYSREFTGEEPEQIVSARLDKEYYDKLALENGCTITPGEAKFEICKLYDDAVTYSFELPRTITQDTGEASERTLTGQVQLDLVQNQVSKITYDAMDLFPEGK